MPLLSRSHSNHKSKSSARPVLIASSSSSNGVRPLRARGLPAGRRDDCDGLTLLVFFGDLLVGDLFQPDPVLQPSRPGELTHAFTVAFPLKPQIKVVSQAGVDRVVQQLERCPALAA